MIPEEGEERRQHHPPVEQLLRAVSGETSGVRADHWHLEDLKVEHALDRGFHVGKRRVVVPEPAVSVQLCVQLDSPMGADSAVTGKGAAGDDEGANTRILLEQDLASDDGLPIFRVFKTVRE